MTTPISAPATGRLDYDGRRFRAVDPDRAGGPDHPVDGPTSVGHYHQDGDLIWAEFSGPTVRAGRLLGTCGPDNIIDAVYCFVTMDGTTIAGACISTPSVLPDGRLRLAEQWRRLDGSSGVSYIEELQ